MTEFILLIIPYLVVVSHLLLPVVFLAIVARNTWGQSIYRFLGGKAVLWGLIITLMSIAGSLFYSEVMGYVACSLCWWQRVFLYPQAIIFGTTLWIRDRDPYTYIVPLASTALIVGLYQVYIDTAGTASFICGLGEEDCSKIYVKEFGYITIPVMSVTASLYVLLLAWVNKLFQHND